MGHDCSACKAQTERERGRWPCRKTWIKTKEGRKEGGKVLVEKVGGGTILRYWKSLWGSKFASEEDHVVQNNNYTHRQNHLNLIALTYCNHIPPHVYMCMKLEQSESHKVRRHDISGTLFGPSCLTGETTPTFFCLFII
jgi:hypothetical protein